MNEQELNKKLAEWAEIKIESGDTGKPIMGDGQMFVSFTTRSGREDWEWRPMFTQSLDACFKWLVPKFKEMCASRSDYEGVDTCDNDIHIFLRLCEGGGWTTKGWLASTQGFRTENIIEGVETPALALCRAIENLIDELP